MFGKLDNVQWRPKPNCYRFQYNFVDNCILKTAKIGKNLYCITEGFEDGIFSKHYGKYNQRTQNWDITVNRVNC